jgi:hypothetical protein
MRLHEPHLVLDRVQAPHADQHRLLFHREGRAHEVAAQRHPFLIGNVDGLARRVQVRNEFLAAGLHLLEGDEAPRVVPVQEELGLAIVVGRAQPAVHGSADVARCLLVESALPVELRHAIPLAVPALQVSRHDARGDHEAFADAAPAFLRLAQPAAELVGEPGMLRPVVPAVGLVVRQAVRRHLLDQVVLAEDSGFRRSQCGILLATIVH